MGQERAGSIVDVNVSHADECMNIGVDHLLLFQMAESAFNMLTVTIANVNSSTTSRTATRSESCLLHDRNADVE